MTIARIATAAAFALALTSARAQSLSPDSLMMQADMMRSAGSLAMAADLYSQIGTDRARVECASTLLEMGRVTDALREARVLLKLEGFTLKDDALLIVAQCRDAQGFDAASNRAYKKLVKNNHAEGAYFYALKLFRQGHDKKAEEMCQRAIRANKTLAPAHQLMASIQATAGQRYQALLPLYRYMLTSSDEGRRLGARQLLTLWRKEAQAIDILRHRRGGDPFSQRMEAVMTNICDTLPSTAPDKVNELTAADVETLVAKTEALTDAMRELGEENLDFWQLYYADMLVEMNSRSYIRPMIYYMLEPVAKGTVLAWVNDNKALFQDFTVWLEGRIGEL